MSEPRAALPMYAREETREAEGRFWALVRQACPVLPELGVAGDLWAHWTRPDLLFSQTCGRPLAMGLRGRVQLLGAPDYGLPGCPPGHYRSVFVMRPDRASEDPRDWAGLTLVRNSDDSQSGWGAPWGFMEARGLSFARVRDSGAHRLSIAEVAAGRADIAAIDAHTWRLCRRHDAEAGALVEVGWTDPTPGTPYIAGLDAPADEIRAAVAAGIAALSDADRDLLGLTSLVEIPLEAYDGLPMPPN